MTTITSTTEQVPTSLPSVTVVVTDARAQRRAQRRYYKWRNQPQSNALATAALIFVSGGMDMAQGLGWNYLAGFQTTLHFQYCWFLGVIAGAFVTSFLVKFVPKIVFYGCGALLMLITGIIFTSAPFNYSAIVAARYLSGISVGITTVTFIVHSSEIAAKNYRGVCTAFEQYGLTFGMAIQIIYDSQWSVYIDFPANRMHGIFAIVVSAFALGSIAFTIESPIFYILRNNEVHALQLQTRLVHEFTTNDATQSTFDDLKCYVIENTSRGINDVLRESLLPFVKLLIYRCFVAFSFSLPLSSALQISSYVAMDYDWVGIVYGVLRFIGALVAMCLLDTVGRKLCSTLGLLCMAGLMLAMAGILANPTNATDWYYMEVIYRLVLSFSFFAGLFTPSSTTYLSEAFPMRVKPFLIALCVSVEQLIHIIVIVSFTYTIDNLYVYFVSVGIILVIGVVLFAVVVPETRGLTLREAQHRFQHSDHVMAY